MREKKKYLCSKYLIGIVLILAVILFENLKVQDYQRQFWPARDWKQISGSQVIDYAAGMKELTPGVLEITEDQARINLRSQSLQDFSQIKIYLTELNASGLDGYVTADGVRQKIWVTKGENIISLSKPLEDGEVCIQFTGSKGVTVNWDKILLLKDEEGFHFPWALFLIAAAFYMIVMKGSRNGQGKYAWDIAGIFLAAGLILFIQFRNVYFYFDDFGYLSLNYQNLTPQKNMDYGLLEILDFLRLHYLHWGGRVLYFFQEIVLGQSIWGIRIAQTLLTMGIFYLTYRICIFEKNGWIKRIAAALPFLCYALLEVDLMRDGAYWFTASVLYVFPVFWVLLGSVLYYQSSFPERGQILGREGKSYGALSAGILFLAAFSQEQIAAAVCGMVFLITAESAWRRKKLEKFQIAANILAWIGCGMLLFCPGSHARLEGTGKKEGLLESVRIVEHIITSDPTKYFSMIIIAAAILISITMLKKTASKIYRLYCICFTAGSLGILGIMAAGGYGILTSFQAALRVFRLELLNTWIYPMLGIYLIMVLGQFFIWYLICHRFSYLAVLIAGAAATLVVACISPEISRRMMLPFYLLVTPAVCDIFVNFAFGAGKNKIRVLGGLLAVFMAIAAVNYHYILYGYFQNSEAEEYNAEILENFEDYADDNLFVQLKKHRDDTFGNMMPYMKGYEWINSYIRIYYEIPEDAIIQWAGEDEIPIAEEEKPAPEKESKAVLPEVDTNER